MDAANPDVQRAKAKRRIALTPAAGDNRLRELRTARGLSGRELALRSGLDFNTVHRLEHGIVMLTLRHMRDLARALDVKPSELLSDDDVEMRADVVGVDLVRELEKIPDGDRVPVLAMARELVRIARHVATTWSGALDGAPEHVEALATLWNGLDDPRRERAVRMLRASLSD